MEAVLAMRRSMLMIAEGYDVMANTSSIAGVAMSVYKKRFLKPDTIAIVPEKGYERHDRASDTAIKLMEWRAKQWGVEIQHAGNGREKQLQINGTNYKVDGFIHHQNRAIEFLGSINNNESNYLFILGCHYHSHPECTKADEVAPNGKLHSINYAETMKRIEEIRAFGVIVDTGFNLFCRYLFLIFRVGM
jgi:hypothetical protein